MTAAKDARVAVTVRLPTMLSRSVKAAAEAAGLSINDYALRCLAESIAPDTRAISSVIPGQEFKIGIPASEIRDPANLYRFLITGDRQRVGLLVSHQNIRGTTKRVLAILQFGASGPLGRSNNGPLLKWATLAEVRAAGLADAGHKEVYAYVETAATKGRRHGNKT